MRVTEVKIPRFNLGNVVTEETYGIKKRESEGREQGRVVQITRDSNENMPQRVQSEPLGTFMHAVHCTKANWPSVD